MHDRAALRPTVTLPIAGVPRLTGRALVVTLSLFGAVTAHAQAAPAADAPAATVASPPASAPDTRDEAKRLHALFDRRWEEVMRQSPEFATNVGDPRYGDRLTDASPEAIAARYASARRTLAEARAIRRDALAPGDQVSLDLFIYDLDDFLLLEPYPGFRSMSMAALDGFHTDFADLLGGSSTATRADIENMIARMAAYPRRVDQELVLLRDGMAAGWVPPRAVLDRILASIDAQLPADLDQSPYLAPFAKLGSDIPPAEQQALRAKARRAVAESVVPAMRKLRRFVAEDYMAKAPADGALSRYPDGDKVYAALVRSRTTTELAPKEIHAIGLRETTRLHGEMEAVMREVKFGGNFAQFVRYLNTDPKFFFPSPETLLAGYRDIAKRIDPELPRLFAELPRAPYGVRAMPSHFGPDRAEYYEGPSLDGTRAGWFNANTLGYRTRPTWSMETLVAHEAVPGHHLQIARAVELGELPKFRRSMFFTAYIEGWAMYAETLGFDVGLYKDPYSRFGHLQWQAMRSARLVVDTGIHAFGWTRQRAIDYMVEQTGRDEAFIASEVDRYYSWPGQALAYMIGELKIIELRERARQKLGPRFDLRRFHRVVLDQGPVPLPLLEHSVDAWIARRLADPS